MRNILKTYMGCVCAMIAFSVRLSPHTLGVLQVARDYYKPERLH
jgi:hypothetical protein